MGSSASAHIQGRPASIHSTVGRRRCSSRGGWGRSIGPVGARRSWRRWQYASNKNVLGRIDMVCVPSSPIASGVSASPGDCRDANASAACALDVSYSSITCSIGQVRRSATGGSIAFSVPLDVSGRNEGSVTPCSVHAMCPKTSRTAQPRQSDGRFHSSSRKLFATERIASRSARNPSTASWLMFPALGLRPGRSGPARCSAGYPPHDAHSCFPLSACGRAARAPLAARRDTRLTTLTHVLSP